MDRLFKIKTRSSKHASKERVPVNTQTNPGPVNTRSCEPQETDLSVVNTKVEDKAEQGALCLVSDLRGETGIAALLLKLKEKLLANLYIIAIIMLLCCSLFFERIFLELKQNKIVEEE